MPRTGKVLILSPHVMTAALVGWYVELARLQPAFAEPGEQPGDALSRVKPLLVVLVDALSEEAISDLFIARASRREIGVAVFSGSTDDHEAREWAHRNGVPFFKLPVDLEAFGRVLDQAARSAVPELRQAERRRPAVERAVDGTLLLLDERGKTWYVYDRRGADRRAYRAFVSGDGTEVRAPLSDQEIAAREANALVLQLARAELQER